MSTVFFSMLTILSRIINHHWINRHRTEDIAIARFNSLIRTFFWVGEERAGELFASSNGAYKGRNEQVRFSIDLLKMDLLERKRIFWSPEQFSSCKEIGMQHRTEFLVKLGIYPFWTRNTETFITFHQSLGLTETDRKIILYKFYQSNLAWSDAIGRPWNILLKRKNIMMLINFQNLCHRMNVLEFTLCRLPIHGESERTRSVHLQNNTLEFKLHLHIFLSVI